MVEAGAGVEAGYPDADYAAKGAKIVSDRAEALSHCRHHRSSPLPRRQRQDRRTPISRFFAAIKSSSASCARWAPRTISQQIAQRGVTSFSVELMPRTTRAQSMDALSSMATIAGYKAVLIAADIVPKFFPMLTTAAGTITPARVLIIGAGVAGLQAIATARRLGAVVSAYDLRPVVKEQVQSLGARFVELPHRSQRRPGRPRLRHRPGRKLLPPPARTARQSHRRKRRRHHHRRHPRQESADPRHQRNGRRHGARLRHRRSRRRTRRQLRTHPPRRKNQSNTASPSSAGSISPAPSPITPARCTPATSPRSSRSS